MIFLAEDDAVIGLNLEDDFRDVGYNVAGPFSTCAAALEWLKGNSPEAAVIDALLKDGLCSDLARELWRRGIPFVVYSGLSQQAAPPVFKGMPWIEKPAPFSTIFEAVGAFQQSIGGIQFCSAAMPIIRV
ncbi:histidine kinase [Microvirga aerilata]|uniref:Histidine kinase n=1 Tax=Microvirga aerilata TaxID=670292 RepID=A0A937D1C1_9HYPH|nr:histidine kinase [Microvirga aerilata]MBL0406831.1 histidine kinase [Microvirga aerilata]